MKWATRGLVGLAALLSLASCLFTFVEAPHSWRASALYVTARRQAADNPGAALVSLLNSIKSFPFETDPRRDAYIPIGELAHRGVDVGEELSDQVYRVSAVSGGHYANLLTARLYWILFTGRAQSDRRAEAIEIIRVLKRVSRGISGLDEAERALRQ